MVIKINPSISIYHDSDGDLWISSKADYSDIIIRKREIPNLIAALQQIMKDKENEQNEQEAE